MITPTAASNLLCFTPDSPRLKDPGGLRFIIMQQAPFTFIASLLLLSG
jgi:hypothetical protein